MKDPSVPPSRKRAAAIQAVGGYVNTGIAVVQGLLLIPLYLHYIGAHMYGLWLASGGVLGLLGMMNFGISSILVQRIANAYGKQDLARAGAYFINGMIVYFAICLLFGLIGWMVSLWLPQILHVEGADAGLLQGCFQLAVAAMAIGVFNECLRSFGMALLRPLVPMVGMVVGRVLGMASTVWMLFDEIGLWAIPAGLLVSECLIFSVNLFNAIFLLHSLGLKMRFESGVIRDYMRTSPPLFMATLGNIVSQQSEPILITMLLNPEVTTAYMVTRRAADILFQMISVIYGSVHSSFSHLAGGSNGVRAAEIATKLLFVSFVLSSIGFSAYVGVNKNFVSVWAGQSFALDQLTVLLIGAGFFFRSVRGMIWQLLKGLSDFSYASVAILIEAMVKTITAMALISILGVNGVPWAIICSCTLSLFILGLRLRNRLSLKLSVFALARTALSALLLFMVGMIMGSVSGEYNSWGVLAVYAAATLAALVFVFLLVNFKMVAERMRRGVA